MNSGYSAAEHRRGSLPNRARQEMEGPQNGQDQVAAMRQRLEGTNVSPKTFLATDYLNHFNEIVMIFGLCRDDPQMIDEVRLWEPKSYEEHFLGSGLSYGPLAVEAYRCAPAQFRGPFDALIDLLMSVTVRTGQRLTALPPHDAHGAAVIVDGTLPVLQRFVEIAGAIINGTTVLSPARVSQLQEFCRGVVAAMDEPAAAELEPVL